MSLDELWTRLENSASPVTEDGVVIRRIDPQSRDNLFVGVRYPARTRLLLLAIPPGHRVPEGSLIQSRGFRTELKHFSGDPPGSVRLFIESADLSFNEVFTMVAADVVDQITTRSGTTSAVSSFLGRLVRWKRFFDSAGPTGLSEEAIRGLIGELIFVRDFALQDCTDTLAVIAAWVGPEPLSKDFEFGSWAVEVKCTSAKEHSRVRVSSEIQLDGTGFSALYLFVVLFEKVATDAEALPKLVSDVRGILGDSAAGRLFDEKLLLCGYHDVHAALYRDHRFLIRRLRAFRLADGFPRIPVPLPDGVGDLNYTLALSACQSFEIDVDELHRFLKERHDA